MTITVKIVMCNIIIKSLFVSQYQVNYFHMHATLEVISIKIGQM